MFMFHCVQVVEGGKRQSTCAYILANYQTTPPVKGQMGLIDHYLYLHSVCKTQCFLYSRFRPFTNVSVAGGD